MNSRDEILADIRARRLRRADRPASYAAPKPQGDAVARFADEVRSAHAEVHMLDSEADVPAAVADILRAKNLPAAIHLPDGSAFAGLPWGSPDNRIRSARPGRCGAGAGADFAVAETGTLAYLAHPGAPASWHFRAGLEIAVVRADAILPHLENVLTRVRARLPHTLNLVTGPSRTGDIEQTLELGAHGPKGLIVLIVKA